MDTAVMWIWFISLMVFITILKSRCFFILIWSWYPPMVIISELYASPGLKEAALQLLPTSSYPFGLEAEPCNCTVCLTQFVVGDIVRVLPMCGHSFHTPCIDKWLVLQSSCPSCRRFVVMANEP